MINIDALSSKSMSRKHFKKFPDIAPEDCYTKAEYARKCKRSQTWVSQQIEKGLLGVISVKGGELVYEKVS